MRTKPAHFILLIALLAASCTAQGAEGEAFSAEWVKPAAKVALGEGETIEIAMGFSNQSSQPISQQDDVAGQWTLVNGEGEVRARGRVVTAGPLEPGETSYPLVWKGALESGSYTLRWGTPAIGTVTTEFTVFESGHSASAGVGVVRQETSDQFLIDQEGAGG
jgi:hypothetical protein